MRFYNNGETIKFKNSNKTIELKPTYSIVDSNNESVRKSWMYRKNKFTDIKDDQEKNDDLKKISDANDYLKEQIKTSRGGVFALSVITAASYIAFNKYGLDNVAPNSIDFIDVSNFALTSSIFATAGTLTISTFAGYIKDVCSKLKLKLIKKEVEENLEKVKEIDAKEIMTEKEEIATRKYSNNTENRYNYYKEFIINSGGKKELFDLPAIDQIIKNTIENGDPIVKAEGRSPIYYKDANEDGTFDICGRMGGHCVTLVYKMEYCHDDNPEHYIVLKKYDSISRQEDNFYNFYGVEYKEIYINKEGNVVETKNPRLFKEKDEFNQFELLHDLKEKRLINKM